MRKIIVFLFFIIPLGLCAQDLQSLITISFEKQNLVIKNNSAEYPLKEFKVEMLLEDSFTNSWYECGGPDGEYTIEPGESISIPISEFKYLPSEYKQFDTPTILFQGVLGIRPLYSKTGSIVIHKTFKWPNYEIETKR
ncbi:MAG: hypothetical protein LBK83_15860 [Treponema sp.]|nr:hypothetical protein [Treponema sp.]